MTAVPAAADLTPAPSPANPAAPIADQQLREAVSDALAAGPLRSNSVPMVAVEVLTPSGDAVEATVRALGGSVTGSVEGQVVQASVPARSVDDLALSDGVVTVQSPQLVTRPPARQPTRAEIGPGFGATVGSNVAVTGADAWQVAGIDGSVRVGIIDYFDRGLWNAAEEGPIPDSLGHAFCLDSTLPPTDANSLCSPSNNNGTNDGDGFEHGVAVAQVVKDMAPAAELYLATVGTVSDLQAAIDWFASNDVHIVTRSLGAAYDGPGDGTGPLAAVVDYAAARNITWFNSGGNDAVDGYARVTVASNLTSTDGYVDFDNGPGVDTFLRVSGAGLLFDGIRWSDWGLPASQRTDYSVEVWAPTGNPDSPPQGENFDPTDAVRIAVFDDNQSGGANPIEAADQYVPAHNSFGFASGISYVRVHRRAGTSQVGPPDTLEVALGFGVMELGRSQAPYSAAKPVVDSRNPALIAVGAIDPANGTGSPDALGYYSSQGPTNDGRIKPDVSAPSCVASTIYSPGCFNGTSAASPTAAGMAALLLDAGVALPGVPLASAMRHFVIDRNNVQGSTATPDGPDNKYGFGQIKLPSPPSTPAADVPAAYHPLAPTRIVDTRNAGPALPSNGILDVGVVGAGGVPGGATAVALNITSVDAPGTGFIQAIPFLRRPYGTSSTINIALSGSTQPNFAIVPIGSDGKISVYDVPGGHIVVDVLGYFAPTTTTVAAGRFVPIDPVRTLDTRTATLVPGGWQAHKPNAEAVLVPPAIGVPATGVSALVLNVTSTAADGAGYLTAEPTGSSPLASTVNYTPGVDSANTVIVPVGPDGSVSVYTSTVSHIIVDVTGYITDATVAPAATGRFVPLATSRAYDSRTPPSMLPAETIRSVQLTGLSGPLPVVPTGASGISINLTAADEFGPGFLSAFPSGSARPATSSLNYLTGQPIANGAVLKLSAGGALDIVSNQPTDVIIDVNGYFT